MALIYKIRNRYSLLDKILLAKYVIQTKIICRSARLIRPPFFMRGGGIYLLVLNLLRGLAVDWKPLRPMLN
jgi:hypothetical protein